MNLSDRPLRLGFAVGIAVLIAVISVVEGSLLVGVLVTTALLAVSGGVLLAGSYVMRSNERGIRDTYDTAHTGNTGDADDPTDPSDVHAHGTATDTRLRGALRVVMSRPWHAGAGVLTVANRAMTSRAGTLLSPRGQRLAAPHLCLEFSPADLAAVTARWPAEILAKEYATAYVDHTRRAGMKRVDDHTVLSIRSNEQVPVGRVVVIPAFALPPGAEPLAQARVLNSCPTATGGPTPSEPVERPTVPPANPTVQASLPANPTVRTAIPLPGNPTMRHPGAPTAGLPYATLTPLDPDSDPIDLRRTSVTVGRESGPDGSINHPSVSRRHVLLSRRENGWTVRDLGSTNGVFVNGTQVTGTTVAVCGDVIRLGADGPRFRLDVHPELQRKEATAA